MYFILLCNYINDDAFSRWEWGNGRVWGSAQWEIQEGNIFGILVTHFGGSFVGDCELEPIAQEDLRAADRK